jgi:cysteine synthase
MRQLSQDQKAEMRASLLEVMEGTFPAVPRVTIPDSIKAEPWFNESGIGRILRLYYFPGCEMRGHNGKSPPAFMSWLMDEQAGKLNPEVTVIGGTSGNWGMASGLIAPMFNVKNFAAVIERSVPEGKQRQLRMAGAKIEFAPDGVPGTRYVYELADQHPGQYHVIDQYVHPGSIIGHRWSMNHIFREMNRLGETPSLFSAVTGTTSTLMAAGQYLKPRYPGMKILGVASMSNKEKVPGSRSPEKLAELESLPGHFEYKKVIDFPLVTSVKKLEVYELNSEFYQQYSRSYGPTCVLDMLGTMHFIRDYWMERRNFDGLLNNVGEIVAVLFFMDMHLMYGDDPEYLDTFDK